MVCCAVAARSVGGTPLVAGKFLGTVGNDAIVDLARLANGDVVVCGNVPSEVSISDVPGVDTSPLGGQDGFLAVLSPDLRTVKAFTYVGGRGMDSVVACAVGPDGRIVVCGVTESEDLKTTQPCVDPTYSSNRDGFVQFYSSNLSKLTYGTYINGNGDDTPLDMKVDGLGHTYICGRTTSIQGLPFTNAIESMHKGAQDGFLIKLSLSGALVVYGTYVGGSADDVFTRMAIREDGAVLLTGWTSSTDFQMAPKKTNPWGWPSSEKPYDDSFNGGRKDAILTLVGADGSNLIFSTFIGGKDDDEGRALGFDGQNNPVILGNTKSSDLPVTAGRQQNIIGGIDGFIATLSSEGKTLLSSSYFGGNGDDIVQTAAWSSGSQFYVMGSTTSRDWSAVGAGTSSVIGGLKDVFLIRVSASQLSYVTTIGGTAAEDNVRMILDDRGDIYAACASSSPKMYVGIDTIENTGPNTTWDGLVFKWAFGTVALSTPTSSTKVCQNQNVTVTWYTADINNQEIFRLDYSTDREVWTNIVDSVVSRTYQWNPGRLDPSKPYWIRLRSGRGHRASHDLPLRIGPTTDILEHPQSVELCSGESLTLTVQAAGEELSYQWKRNGTDLTGQTSSTLFVQDVTLSSAGTYTVSVVGSCGQVLSTPASVKIVESTVMTEQPNDADLEEGERLELVVKANIVSAEYQWYKDNVVLNGETTPRLVIPAVTMDDAGAYHCVASASCGTATSTRAVVRVTETVTRVDDGSLVVSSVSPQPASDRLTVRFRGEGATEYRLRDVMGRTIIVTSVGALYGDVILDIDVSTCAAGTYILDIVSGSSRTSECISISS